MFQPPTQFAVRPKQAVDNLYYLEGTKLFIRVCVPRNTHLNFQLKRQDPIAADYESSPDYIVPSKKSRIYDEYTQERKRERDRARRQLENTDQEIELLKKYLDTEEQFIEDDRKKEKKITEDELKKIEEEFKKLRQDIVDPLKKIVDEMKDKVEEDQKLEEKGVQDVDLDDILDDDDGIKQGLKITYNNIFDLESDLAVRIKVEAYFEEKLVFDEFGNPCLYETPIVDDHCPKVTINSKRKRKAQKTDPQIEEVQYILKHFPGYIEVFKRLKNVYLRFIVEEVVEEGTYKDKPRSYLRKHRVREVGWFIFKVTDVAMNIREGRFKLNLYKLPKQKVPLAVSTKDLKQAITSLDFTIEIFEYTSKDKGLFSFRRRAKKFEEKKKYPLLTAETSKETSGRSSPTASPDGLTCSSRKDQASTSTSTLRGTCPPR